jgi:hypothetical protein
MSVLITKENNKMIRRFMTEYMTETQDGMSYAEASNWLLHFGIANWFREGREGLRSQFYKVWAGSPSHKKYAQAIDEFDFLEFIQKKRNEQKREE